MPINLESLEEEVPPEELAAFKRFSQDYTLISKIGEGTFSTVYKAEDKYQFLHDNQWLLSRGGNTEASYYVAIKKIYVTSSPARILNEIDILRSLAHSDNVLPMITAFRAEDQVFIVLPYFKHPDFRSYYRDLPLRDVRYYMRSLFRALKDVHQQGVLHRDVKPTNFLYDVQGRKGELVDFGLAERVQVQGHCPCRGRSNREFPYTMVNPTHAKLAGVYLQDDRRPGKRANRAGTRGFRAPEVLFKCDNQTPAVDVWSAGVILISFLTARFPFFNSNDDVDALIEISSIFGKVAMKKCAGQHDCSFETTIPSLHDRPISFTRLIHWSTDSSRKTDDTVESKEQALAVEFLEKCMVLDFWQRWSAEDALEHAFLKDLEKDEMKEKENRVLQETIAQQLQNLDEYGSIEPPAQIEEPVKDTGRAKERVFLATDENPDEQLHDRMRQEAIHNVNLHRIRREQSQRALTEGGLIAVNNHSEAL